MPSLRPLSERARSNLRYKHKVTDRLATTSERENRNPRNPYNEKGISNEIDSASGIRVEIPAIKMAGGFAGLFITLRLWQQSGTDELFVLLAAAFLVSSVVSVYSGAYGLWRKVPLTQGKELIFPIAQLAMAVYFYIQEF